MAWDSARPVPWKRMGIMLGIYLIFMVVFVGLSDADGVAAALPSLLVAIAIAAMFLWVMVKLGWTMPGLRSREELAAARNERIQARQAARGGGTRSTADVVDGPRPKAAPTSRTSTGPSQHKKKH